MYDFFDFFKIRLLPFIIKVMESIIAVDIKSYLLSNRLISDQFGFRPGHSPLHIHLLLSHQCIEDPNVRYETYLAPCSPNSLPMTSQANSTHGLLTFSTLSANMCHSMESFHLLSLFKLECPKAVF